MRPLSLLNPGERGTVCRVQGIHSTLRQRLLELGLISGTAVEVVCFAPLGDPMEVRVNGYRLSLRRKEAEAILVHEENR